MLGHELTFLFAPGAGAPSSSAWMQSFAERLGALGEVVCFDYPYQRVGRRTPDRLPVLVREHRERFERLRAERSGRLVLIGKSMGGRIGCHVASEVPVQPDALVCLGYPLVGRNGARRDVILRQIETPILFVQGARDSLCPLDELAAVRAHMRAPNELHVVPDADHSLTLTRTALARQGLSEPQVAAAILAKIGDFLERTAAGGGGAAPTRKGR